MVFDKELLPWQKELVEKIIAASDDVVLMPRRHGKTSMMREVRRLRLADGEPCGHAGCLNHVTHPCEGCGRIAGHAAHG